MIIFENIYTEIYISVILLSVLFLLLHRLKGNSLLAVIIILIIGYSVYYYLYEISQKKEISISNLKNTINEDIQGRTEISEDIFYNRTFPKSLKYLKESDELMAIATNVRFVKKFNKSVYADLLNNMNSFMKIYIYILSERYSANQVQLFIDYRDNILELMYSFIILVPEYLKHTYGFNAYEEIHKSIDDFTIHSRKMMEVLDNFCKIHLNDVYIPIEKYKPYNSVKSSYIP